MNAFNKELNKHIKDENISNKRAAFIDQYQEYRDIIQSLFCLYKYQDTCFELLNLLNIRQVVDFYEKKQFIYLENIFKNNEKEMRLLLLFSLFEYSDFLFFIFYFIIFFFFEFLNALWPYSFLEKKKLKKKTVSLTHFLFN